jgi:hypothetical protein
MSHHAAATTPSTTQIDLAVPRTIALNTPRGDRTLFCRRVAREDWDAFFDAVYITETRIGLDIESTVDIQRARLVLADRVLIGAGGYRVEGDDPIDCVPEWQSLLPISHREQLGAILASTRVDGAQPELISVEGEAVVLGCVWTMTSWRDDAGEHVGMQHISGLRHILRAPTARQHQRYSRETSRTIILGGDRAGTTQRLGAQKLMAELYDEMIISVDGYCLNGTPLEGRDNIAREMDTHHKVTAARQIFEPLNEVTTTIRA